MVPNEDPVINLEHVLPENPGSGWPNIDPETAGAVFRRLGNMVLLQASRNTAIGNADFATKKPILAASTYVTTKDVADASSWGLDEINERQKKLAKHALKLWPMR